jgi:hypothetical protein
MTHTPYNLFQLHMLAQVLIVEREIKVLSSLILLSHMLHLAQLYKCKYVIVKNYKDDGESDSYPVVALSLRKSTSPIIAIRIIISNSRHSIFIP